MFEVSIHYPIGRLKDAPAADKVRIEFVCPKRPILFWAEYKVYKQIQFPRGYGVAYKDFLTDKILFAPMPLNLIVGAVIWIYQWTRIGFARWCFYHAPRKTSGDARKISQKE